MMKSKLQSIAIILLSALVLFACKKDKDPAPGNKDMADPAYALVSTTWITETNIVIDTLDFLDVNSVKEHGLAKGAGHFSETRAYHFEDPNITIEAATLTIADTIKVKVSKFSGTVNGDKMTLKNDDGDSQVYHKLK